MKFGANVWANCYTTFLEADGSVLDDDCDSQEMI